MDESLIPKVDIAHREGIKEEKWEGGNLVDKQDKVG